VSRFTLFVPGRPVPQGSKTAFISKSTGRPVVVDKDVRLPNWRAKITGAAIEHQAELLHTGGVFGGAFPLDGPIGVEITFVLERPKFHYGTGRNADRVKDSSPLYPATMPDLDKLLRAVFDGLTDAQVWRDDGQVVWCQTSKRYPLNTDAGPGVLISVGRMTK
jgi:crossover junction endodeoxyribonuclease RusA